MVERDVRFLLERGSRARQGGGLVSADAKSHGPIPKTEETEAFFAQANKDTWQTPPELLAAFDAYDPIHTDPCAGPETRIASEYNWTIEDDGLAWPWFGTVFINPPFKHKTEWLDEALARLSKPDVDRIYVLLPDSTDVKSWFHGKVVPHANYVWFSRGRVKFIDPVTGEQAGSPTFGTCIAMFGEEPPASMLKWFSENGWLVRSVKP